jgi:hypothetical protein
MVFYVPESELGGAEQFNAILRRHVSYFGDIASLEGLLRHIGGEESAYYNRVMDIIQSIGGDSPREPFELWEPVDPDFKDLVGKMTSMEPARRISAREALGHCWFDGVESV